MIFPKAPEALVNVTPVGNAFIFVYLSTPAQVSWSQRRFFCFQDFLLPLALRSLLLLLLDRILSFFALKCKFALSSEFCYKLISDLCIALWFY